MNENPNKWQDDKNKTGTIKIISLNCAGLHAHFGDISTDNTLKKADIIHLIETSLKPDEDVTQYRLEGYASHFISIGNGKGIVTYCTT